MSKDTSLPVIDNPTLSGLKKAHFLTRKLAISIKTPRAVLSTTAMIMRSTLKIPAKD
jgi:hypothetical protein